MKDKRDSLERYLHGSKGPIWYRGYFGKSAISETELDLILDHFLMIVCIMWATFYLACLITFLVTSSFHFQISGHKFKCVGVVRRGE